MYVSRLAFATLPGRTHEAESKLRQLRDLVAEAGGRQPRVFRTHFASPNAPDLVFEQEASDLAALEQEIGTVTGDPRFQALSREISGLLAATPKREVYRLVE
ncbi:MAG TPA: hypothetical protein VHS99_03180 [Chloroflexota bacterium]|jgi:hypothetical protein|nr:hypothetical protein [Chloroflexota bacterium]